MTLQTTNPNLRVEIERHGRAAYIHTKVKTPDGWEKTDTEEVETSALRDVLQEWYDVPVAQLRKV